MEEYWEEEKSEGRDIRVVYSTMDAIELAVKHPDREVIFPGVGFETTAPTIAAAIKTAEQMKLTNFSVYAAHKTVPPALQALMSSEVVGVDGFILPGHVSLIIGTSAYEPFFKTHAIPCVVAGFEPADLVNGLILLAKGYALFREAAALRPGAPLNYLPFAVGIVVGSLKVRYVFVPACQKNLARIDALAAPKLWQFFRPGFFLGLALMITLGATLSRAAQGNYPFLNHNPGSC